MPSIDYNLAFLAGSDEMSALMREHDWSTSAIDDPTHWPQALRSAVGLMLPNKHVMFVAWGPELSFLYNDAYIPVFGKKHPWALGRPFKEIWPEVWDEVEPLINAALGGDATWSENLHLVLERNGYPEDCWFTFSYSPVRDEHGTVVGLFCAASETTEMVVTERRNKDQADRQRLLFEKAPGFIAILTGPNHVFEFVNDAYVLLAGGRESIGKSVRQVFPEIESHGLHEVLDNVYATGERFVADGLALTFYDTPNGPGRNVVLNFIYEPIRDEAGNVTGIFVEGHDVTEAYHTQAALRDSEARFHALFAASPVPFMVLQPNAPDFKITAANDAYFAATLTTPESLIGRRLFDVFPDDVKRPGQLGSEALAVSLEHVLATQKADVMERVRYDLVLPDGGFEPHWWEAINAPMLDDTGEVSAIIHQVTRVTEQHYRDQAELDEQRHQAFLLNLSDSLRAEPSADAMAKRAIQMLSEIMHLDRCYVGIYRLEEDIGEFPHQVHLDHLAPLPGQVRLSDFPDALQVAFDRTLVIDDASTMEGFSDRDRASFGDLGLSALISATLRKGELNPLWAIVAASNIPRRWTHNEISLVEEVAERTWAAVEQARISAALLASDERHAFLLRLSDTLRSLRDPLEVQDATMRLVVEHLDVMRSCYFQMDEDQDGFTLAALYDVGTSPAPQSMRISDFDPDMVEGFRQGQTVVITDAEVDAPTELERSAYREIGVRSGVGVPLVKDGILIGVFGVQSANPRRWSDPEIQLLEDVADRVWTAADRARSEREIHESEERFRRFSDASTSVLWIRDAATMRMEFASPAFDKIYGMSGGDWGTNAELSTWASLIEPENRDAVLQSFDQVRSGERIEQEFEIRRGQDGTRRWIHDTTFPLRNKDGAIQYIAGVGSDITEMKENTDRQEVLVLELQHRTRNLITVIGALADRTLGNATSLDDFSTRFHLRLSALSRVQGMLSHLAAGDRITFSDLLHSELDVYGATNGMAHKFTLQGPDDVPLGSGTIQTFALALHELTINAIKYGALAAPNGHLLVRWCILPAEGSKPPRLQVVWRESGVEMPALEGPAKGGGYGRELIERALPYQLKAKTTYELGPDGVHCTIDVPMSRTALGGVSDYE